MAEEDKPQELRNYQAEMFEIVKETNSILFLPTGSGKTCIAIWLIKHLSCDLKKPFSEGGKRTIFLVNTTELAYQQAKYVEQVGNFNVRTVCGKEGVDNWRKEQYDELEYFHVIVLTSQCYLNALIHGYMELEKANLLIFDECHHAVNDHPMREIMKKFDLLPNGNDGPRVLGLSATILNSNVKTIQLISQMEELERTFRASIVTSTFTFEIKKFATKPRETIKDFQKYQLPDDVGGRIVELKEASIPLAQSFKLKDDEIVEFLRQEKPEIIDILMNAPGQNRRKMLINAVKDIEVHCRDFGSYIGFICCNLYIIQMYRFMFTIEKTQYVDLVLYFISIVQQIRKILYDEIMKVESNFSLRSMLNVSTQKLGYLFEILRQLKSTDKCIIFVERKMTAKALYVIIKMFARSEKNSVIHVDFITGSDCNPLRNTRELFHEKKMRDKILKSFRGDKLNVLVATNIVEEGIDIPNCGLVIMFDEIKTYRSYVQSKGRARMAASNYIVLNDVPREKFEPRISSFRGIEKALEKFVLDKEVNWDDDINANPAEGKEFFVTSKNASIKEENAVPLLYRYCSTLPHDLFTQLLPFWWLCEKGEEKYCKLLLPVNSPLRDILEGPLRSNAKKAKQAVAFEAVKQLHKLGALDDRLLPVSCSVELEDILEWVPNWEKLPATKNGEKTTVQDTYVAKLKLPKFLRNCRPVANAECYMHRIDITTEYDSPDLQRRIFCHKLMELPYSFGILTQKPLPELCRFPIYSDLGRVRISIRSNAHKIFLDEKKLHDVSKFHRFLFLNVLGKMKKFFMFDVHSTSYYFIVPLIQNERGVDIAWKVIREKYETKITRPSELERETMELSEEMYLGKVVTPWYQIADVPKFYIVTNYKTGKHLHSKMDNNKKTFAEHYETAYGLEALQPGQPMMEVRPITNLLDSIKPRPVTSSAKQKKRQNVDHPIFLPPEFVTRQTFPSVYWYKSILLPSILYRFHQLLLAEDLRQKIVTETGVGRLELTINEEDERNYFIETAVNQQITVQTISNTRKFSLKERKSSSKNEQSPDLIRDIYHVDLADLTVDDVNKFANYVDQPLEGPNQTRSKVSGSAQKVSVGDSARGNDDYIIDFEEPPSLMSLRDTADSQGPNHYEILQALTWRGANDTIDLERFETLGDSLLKYLVSFAIFIREGKMNEGLLTSLKGRIIGNKYLFDCAKKHKIPEYMQVTKFTVDHGWIPPAFGVPRQLRDFLLSLSKLSGLLTVTIPYHEQFSGNPSLETIDSIKNDLSQFFQTVEDINKGDELNCLFYLGARELSHKSIADVVEALIGVYLETCGIRGAFNVMKYFGILQKEDYTALMSHKIVSVLPPEKTAKVLSLIPDYRQIEQLVNYEFKDKSLLLQAVTHPSCLTNPHTDCYQKLEFIGDAVLDFLITSYIYEYCGKLSPGQITDLRSALVNNNTFGAMTVRLGLHKFILNHCKALEDAIASFVAYQRDKDFRIHGNELMVLVNEDDTVIAEEVDVPKALGDVFESLAGAIFIDSEYDLNLIWKIYFNIMAEEIAKFCSKVPINPIRALYEVTPKIQFDSNVKNKNQEYELGGDKKLIVHLCVHTKNDLVTVVGRGVNTASAKRAAAKLALKHLGYTEFVI